MVGGRCVYCGAIAPPANVCHAHSDLTVLDPHLRDDMRDTTATIQAVDTDDDTIYVLRDHDGKVVATAPWPSMLEALAPHATRIPSYVDVRHTIVVQVGPTDQPLYSRRIPKPVQGLSSVAERDESE